MTRRETVEVTLKKSLGILLRAQAKSLKTGPIDPGRMRVFLWYGGLLRGLPHYNETELLGIQRMIV